MQPATDGPGDLGQAPLDGHVDVFVVRREREGARRQFLGHGVEAGQQSVAVLRGDDPSLAASILAWARDCAMSCGQSLRS